MKTQAAILVKTCEPLFFMELEIPILKPGQVLVKMLYSGVCRTQINEILGLKGPDPYLPHTLGHEGSGIVVETGPKVTKVKEGDSVVVSWIKGEGLEASSTQYQGPSFTVNSGAVSTFIEYAVISENRLVTLPSEISLKEAALLGCAFSTGAGAIWNEMKLQELQSIGIFGLGGIGMSALVAAAIQKASPIIAIDIHEEKLKRAQSLGATHVVNPAKENALEAIQTITEGKLLDYTFESAGVSEVMELAFTSVKPKIGKCFIAGNLPKGGAIKINPFDLILGKSIYGTWGGGSKPDVDIPRYCTLIQQKKLALSPLISDEVPLLEINSLIEKFQRNEVQRGLIHF